MGASGCEGKSAPSRAKDEQGVIKGKEARRRISLSLRMSLSERRNLLR